MALSNLGTRSKIASLTEGSVESDELELWYEYSRLTALESYDWSFARKRVALALHSDDPPEDIWAFRYQYPADCVTARKIENPNGMDADAVPFEIETSDDGSEKTILTNMEDAVLVYTFDQQDTSLYRPFFVKMFSYVLAHEVAIALTGKLSIKQAMAEAVSAFVRAAPAADGNERVGRKPRDAEWIRFRTSNSGTIGQDWEALPDAEN
jgi:hypothetical protein